MAVGSWREKRLPKPLPTLPPTDNRQPLTGQEGFTLAGLIVILTIISIVIAFTVPEQWSMVMGRERDRQTIFLMKQYARGILAWQKKNGAVPTSLDQLIEAERPRMLRGTGKWPCPITGREDDWILVPPGAVPGQPGAAVPPPPGGGNPAPAPQQVQQQPSGPSQLNKDASPKDYIGPFVGVRPNASGPSFLALNGAEDYSEWVYTVADLQTEIAARQASYSVK